MSKNPKRPAAVAFDVIETLFTIEPLEKKLKAAGLPSGSLQVWFARFLRDAFALEVSGEYRTFGEVASATLEVLLSEHKIDINKSTIDETDQSIRRSSGSSRCETGFANPARIRCTDCRVNERQCRDDKKLFKNAGLEDFVERYISTDEVKHWKPATQVYLHAARAMRVDSAEIVLVAAHDWDVHGANKAGLTTGFVARKGQRFSSAMEKPDVSGGSLKEVVQKLLALPER